MSSPDRAEQIARYRNMVEGDPEDDLAHFRLGQALMDDEQYPEAVKVFERTLELTPGFSRVFQYLGDCLIKAGQKDRAIEVLTKGWTTANERGDRLPMEAMGKLLASLGAAIPSTGRRRRKRTMAHPAPASSASGRAAWKASEPVNSRPLPFPTPSASASTPISARAAGPCGTRT